MKSALKPRNHVFLAMRKSRNGGEHQQALKPSRARQKLSLLKELKLQNFSAKSDKDFWPCVYGRRLLDAQSASPEVHV